MIYFSFSKNKLYASCIVCALGNKMCTLTISQTSYCIDVTEYNSSIFSGWGRSFGSNKSFRIFCWHWNWFNGPGEGDSEIVINSLKDESTSMASFGYMIQEAKVKASS